MIAGAENLVVRFRRGLLRRPFAALSGLDLEIREGDFFALLGQNGAGKSTVMHCLVGLLRPTQGRVHLLGRRPEPGSPVFAEVGYLPEEPRYHEFLTVEEAVTYYARLSGVDAPAARVARTLERLGMAEHRGMLVRHCSKGMKQKVGIAQCLLHEPRVLFLDEPMRGLDPMTVHLVRELLVEMNRAGATLVMNSHLLSEVELVANRVAIIDRGRLVVQQHVSDLRATRSDRYALEIETDGDLPPHLDQVVRTNGCVHGTVPAGALYDFMDYSRANGVRVVSCTLQQQTLEESFLEVLRREAPHA